MIPALALALLSLSLQAAPAAPAAADPARLLEEARRAADAFDLESARAKAERALRSGQAGPELAFRIHALLGEVLASMGRSDEARGAFACALELSPGFEFPPQTSPKLLEPLSRAREQLSGASLRAAVSAVRRGERASAQLRVEGDVLGLVQSVRLWVASAGGPRPSPEASAKGASWDCEDARCAHAVALVDAYGNELWRAGAPDALREVEPALDASPPPAAEVLRPAPEPRSSFLSRPWPWLGAAAACAAAGVLLAIQVHRDEDRMASLLAARSGHGFAELEALDRSRRTARGAAVGAAAASAGFGAVGAVLVW